jgi:hypothetical protein
MRGRTGCLILLLLLVPSVWAEIACAQPSEPRRWRLGDYFLLIERTAGGPFEQDLLTVREGGRLLHAEVAAHINFVTSVEGEGAAPALVAITGLAKKDLVVQSFSGGAHCCFSIEILTLGARFAASPTLDTRDAGAALIKLHDSGLYGLKSSDETYNYRFSSFVDSPHPEIIIRYDTENGFRLATDMMRRPKQRQDALTAAALKIQAEREAWQLPMEFLPGAYLRPIFEMIYSGDMEGARFFASAAWPGWKPGFKDFSIDLFNCALPQSPWWTAIAELNSVKAYAESPNCKAKP